MLGARMTSYSIPTASGWDLKGRFSHVWAHRAESCWGKRKRSPELLQLLRNVWLFSVFLFVA